MGLHWVELVIHSFGLCFVFYAISMTSSKELLKVSNLFTDFYTPLVPFLHSRPKSLPYTDHDTACNHIHGHEGLSQNAWNVDTSGFESHGSVYL